MWYLVFGIVVLALSALTFALYRNAVCGYERKVIEEYEEARREEQRRRQGQTEALVGSAVSPHLAYVPAPEDEEFQTECADVLAQLEQRRRELRRSERLAQRQSRC